MFFKKKKVQEAAVQARNIDLASFNEEVIKSDQIVVLDFWAPWCGPCKVMGPILDEVAEKYYGKALVGKVNVDRERELAGHFGIRSIPTLLFIYKGKIVEHYTGVVPQPNIEKIIEDHQ